jgi:uncharacterized protein
MTKPVGPICNLDCTYCFYLEKEAFYGKEQGGVKGWAMPEDVLARYIQDYIAAHAGHEEITFAWQGGEPTLLGIDYFRKVVELQRWHAPTGVRIANTFQTNGTLIDDAWAAFLADHAFLVGVSIDGPAHLHDRYRVDKGGKPTHGRVLAGIEHLKRRKVAFNTLTVVNRLNAKHPAEVYRFLRDIGSGFMQFIPLAERPPAEAAQDPHRLAGPPQTEPDGDDATGWSVRGEQWGEFLVGVWDEWIKADVGKVFVNLFDVQLGLWAGLPASLCVFAKECGKALAMEHNGDLYACDHYVYPEYRLGNIMAKSLGDMARSKAMEDFGSAKRTTLPRQCRECRWLDKCNGECPKHRFLTDTYGEPGLNWLCAGYIRFFEHVDKPMRIMVDLLNRQQAPALVMEVLAEERRQQQAVARETGRNDPCPCGSGRKFKLCHGR